VSLTAEQETLLITLFCKTLGSPEGYFEDPAAWRLVESIDYDFDKLRVKTGTRLTVPIRAKKIDSYVHAFLQEHPDGVVLHLGCGLDTRFQRLDNGKVEWYDLDLPDAIVLRRKFFEESDRYHMIASSVTAWDWLNLVRAQGRAVFVAAEGLLMYLHEEDVKALMLKLKEHFPGCGLACDVFSGFTARNVRRNPSLQKTGAVIHWGIDDAREIESWAPGIRLLEEWYFDQSADISKLAGRYRLMFAITRLFSAARKAHRVLYFKL
jgi:O-methyltransferase involved in polyketide biosynthesis